MLFIAPANQVEPVSTRSIPTIEWIAKRQEARNRLMDDIDAGSVAPHSRESIGVEEFALPELVAQRLRATDARGKASTPALQPTRAQKILFDQLKKKSGFRHLYQQLAQVRLRLEDYDEEFARPTAQSAHAALSLLVSAGARHRGAFPEATVCADGEGGLSLEWHKNGRGLLLLIPPMQGQAPRLYHLDDSGAQPAKSAGVVTPTVLAAALGWVSG